MAKITMSITGGYRCSAIYSFACEWEQRVNKGSIAACKVLTVSEQTVRLPVAPCRKSQTNPALERLTPLGPAP